MHLNLSYFNISVLDIPDGCAIASRTVASGLIVVVVVAAMFHSYLLIIRIRKHPISISRQLKRLSSIL